MIQGPTTNVWNCVWNYLKFCITATSPTSPLGWTKAAVLVAIRRRSYDMFKMHTNWCISIRTGKAMYIRFALILSNGHFQIVALVCNIKILFCILSRFRHLRISQSEEVTLGCQINESIRLAKFSSYLLIYQALYSGIPPIVYFLKIFSFFTPSYSFIRAYLFKKFT